MLNAKSASNPIFYTLTKIHKPNPVEGPIISGCDSATEQISSFVEYLFQPIAKSSGIIP